MPASYHKPLDNGDRVEGEGGGESAGEMSERALETSRINGVCACVYEQVRKAFNYVVK